MAYSSLAGVTVTTGVRCRVCGCGDVHTDAVLDGEELFLAECPHCDHRWTARASLPRVQKRVVRSAPFPPAEVASAA